LPWRSNAFVATDCTLRPGCRDTKVGRVELLDPSLVEAFQTRGAVVVRDVFEPAWIETLREVVSEILGRTYAPDARTGERSTSQSVASDGMWRWCEPFARFLFTSPIGDTAASVMRSETTRLFEDLFLYTEAGYEGASWHRDSPHWPIKGRQLCSVWFSLEPVDLESGALHFVAGSHLDGESVASEGLAPDFESVHGQREVIGFATEPGDAVVFHPRLLHAALGSRSNQARRTFTIRFAGDDIRWRPRRAYYHEWMEHAGLQKGDALEHPWFPLICDDVTARLGGAVNAVEPTRR
jgi:ectoine hydroxylase-related dioxygenase (phytanoyl-CoA dioxygenase family)